MAGGRIAIGVDVGGSGIKAAVVDVEAGRFRSERHPRPDTDAVEPGSRECVDRPARQAARAGERAGLDDAGRYRSARGDHRRDAQDGREHRSDLDRFPGGRPADPRARPAGLDRQRRRRRGPRRDAVRRRARSAGGRDLPHPRDGRRFGGVRRRQARAEHRVRSHGDPRPRCGAAVGGGGAAQARPVVEGLGARISTSTSTGSTS